MTDPAGALLAALLLKAEAETFLHAEADLLDERRFEEWLDLLCEDLVYFMPVRRNVRAADVVEREDTRQGAGISWFDEDKWTLTKRVEQILTGVHYAEEPLSRVSHIVANVSVAAVRPDGAAAGSWEEAEVTSRFVVHQNRVQYETYLFVGRRHDTLRREHGRIRLARREIVLDQNVLLAKNLTTFF